MEKMENIKKTIKRPEIYKPFRFLIVIFGLLELSGFAVLANYSIIMLEVRIFFCSIFSLDMAGKLKVIKDF